MFNSVKKKVPLRSFAKNVWDNYYLPPVPAVIPNAILATLALMVCALLTPLSLVHAQFLILASGCGTADEEGELPGQ